MDWSSDLLRKIESEGQDVARQLATTNPSDSLAAVRTHSERKLLAMTPRALDVLNEGMEAGQTKDRTLAASKVLDLSPATRIQTVFGSEQTIPIEALTTILQSMANMFRGASVQFATDAPKEKLDEASDQSVRTLGRPDAVLARRPSIRSNSSIHIDGIPKKETVSSSRAKVTRRTKQHKAKD